MRKTANYDLCQWDAEDRILREDFNSDNEKIDAAIADAGFLAKLLDVTTQEPCTQLDLDVSGIQPEQYAKLLVRPTLRVSSQSNTAQILIRSNQYTTYRDGTSYGYSACLARCFASPENTGAGGGSEITLMSATMHLVAITDFFSGITSTEQIPFYAREVYSWNRSGAGNVLIPLETLNFYNPEGLQILAGSRILIYGVKK